MSVAVFGADIDVVAQVLELQIVPEASVVSLLVRDRRDWAHTVLLRHYKNRTPHCARCDCREVNRPDGALGHSDRKRGEDEEEHELHV